jgi:GT2 family glycosyltransferase
VTVRAASDDAPAAGLREENEQLRHELARRRYDAHLASVLIATIRTAFGQLLSALTRPLAALARGIRAALARLAPPASRRRSALRSVARRGLAARRGTTAAPERSGSRRYRQYYAHTRPSDAQLRSRVAALGFLERHPVVSVVVVDARGDLAETLGSLSVQVYDRVEVLVVSSSSPSVPESVTLVGAAGSAEAQMNAGVLAASGDYVLVLLGGDLLAPHAIYDLVSCIAEGYDAAYGDEDRCDQAHEHVEGHLKPAVFGRETLYSYDVVGAPLLVDRALFVALGGYDPATTPVAAHDFALRLTEATERIGHVAEVLLTRPTALDPDPMDATAATIPVVAAAIARAGGSATVAAGEVLVSVRYTVAPPSPAPSVAIVIPTRDRLDLLQACVESVERRTTYPNYSIVICDNDSVEPETLAWMAASRHAIVRCPGPFNYAAIMNRGVAHTSADFVVTLNNDTTIATPEWLDHLVGLCAMPKVASVGAKLAYPDGRLQHEGVGIIPLPVHLSRDQNYATVDRWLASTRDAAAVTGACQIVRTEAWHELGGLDERLAVAFNDVDFGMRLCVAGWRVVYTPEVLLGHRESASRGDLHPPADEALLIARWDLHGRYQDPSMPPAVRLLTAKVEVDVPARGRRRIRERAVS